MRLNYGFWVRAFLMVFMVPSAFLRAHVLAQSWQWFVVPLGVAMLGKAHIYGLAMLAFGATYQIASPKDKEIAESAAARERDATSAEKRTYVAIIMAQSISLSLILWGSSYILHLIMG